MKCLLLLLVAVTMATGSVISVRSEGGPPKPCQTAAQWEGRASEWDHTSENNNRFIVSFDGVGLRKRVKEEKKSFMPGKRFYEYIMEYKTNTLYTINLNYATCEITNLTEPWQNHTIPTDATMEDEYELGPPGSGFLVREWSDRLPARRAERWIGIFTIEGCWPVVEITTMHTEEVDISYTTRFFDLTEGIKNMSVFTPPSFCHPKYGHLPDEPELVESENPTESNEVADMYAIIEKGWRYLKSWF